MRRPLPIVPCLLLISLAGCSSTVGSRFGLGPGSRSIAMVGDRPLPAASGPPGSQVAADLPETEPRRNPKARISGRVVDEEGRPASGVTVRLADGGIKGGRDIRATTDRSGAFTLNGLRPGSTYSLVAESDDEENLSGRAKARTPESNVEIVLSRAEETTAAPSRSGRASRARPISKREEEEAPPEEEAASLVNREDLPSTGGADEPEEDVGPRPSRPRLSTPEPTVGWKKGSTSKPDLKAEQVASSETDEEEGRSRRSPSREAVAEDENLNPLPPAIDRKGASQSEDQDSAPAPLRKGGGRRSASPADSGSFSLTPEAAELSTPLADPPSNKVARRKVASEPPPLPEVEPVTTASALAPGLAGKSGLEPDPARVGEWGGGPAPSRSEGGGLEPPAVAVADPPGANSLPPPPAAITPTPSTVTPASRPVFASTGGPMEPGPSPATAQEYNPFLLASAPAAADAPTPDRASAPQIPADTPKSAMPPPRKTWGEVAAIERPTPAVEPAAKPSASLIKRLRGTSDRKDVAISLCNYDARLPKLIDFQLPDLEGKPVRFQDLDSDYILLEFWGTWWKPCLESIPHLVELQKQYGPRRLRVVGIACEKVSPEQPKTRVEEVSRRLGINYAVLLSGMDGKPCPVQQSFQIQAYPSTILLDRSGRVLWRNAGATPATRERLDRVLAGLSRSETVRR